MRDPGSHSRAAMRIYYVRIGDSGRQGKQSPEKKSQKNPAHRPQSEDRQAADVPASNSGVPAVRPFEAADQWPRFGQQRTARPGWTTRWFDFAQHTLTSASKHISTPTRPRRAHPLGCSDSKSTYNLSQRRVSALLATGTILLPELAKLSSADSGGDGGHKIFGRPNKGMVGG